VNRGLTVLQRSVCPQVLQSYTIKDEDVNPLTPREEGIHCFKLEFCVRFVQLFKECHASVK